MEATEFQHLYPSFQLKDELMMKGGRDVMTGLYYERRRNRGAPKQGTPPASPIPPPEPAAVGDAPH
jgi:hypothetical protein